MVEDNQSILSLLVKPYEFSRWVLGFLEVLPVRSSICGWPAPTSLLLEDVVELLKFLFARGVAQDISSLEEYGSILL